MEFELLTTQRLLLKKFTAEGFAYLFEHSSKEEIKQQLGLTTDEEFIKEKEKNVGGYKTFDRTILHFKLILKETNEVIGGGGFHNWYLQHAKAELGYALTKEEHKRKGYMSEAVNRILEYGFNTMNLNRVEACIGPENMASISLIKKWGFTREGYLRQHYMRDGAMQDSIIFSLLKEEYKVLKWHNNC
jgi:ribosomal-protein-alanine N-acetyltransferase